MTALASPIYAEMDRLKVLMRDCQHGFRSRPFEHTRKDAEVCAAAMKRIEGMAAGADSEVQVEYMFLCRDYSCLAARVALAAGKQPKQRSYLEFPGGECVLESEKPERIGELYKLLEAEGLLKHLNVKIIDGKIHFKHSSSQLNSLIRRYPKLCPYFREKPLYGPIGIDCFYVEKFSQTTSEMGLTENPITKQTLVRSLVEQANRHFQSTPISPPVEFTFNAEASDRENLRAAYSKFPCLCVGDYHRERSARNFIIDNMATLRDLGVKTLFMEDFQYDTMQPLLDHYFDTPGAEMPLLLRTYAEEWDEEYKTKPPHTFLDLLKKAKQLGIRIVGIDTSVAYDVAKNDKEDPFERVRAMNFVAQPIIDREKGNGKFLAFMGTGHAVTMTQYRKDDPSRVAFASAGMADLLQCPLIYVSDSSLDFRHGFVNSANYGLERSPGLFRKHVHLHLLVPQPKGIPQLKGRP